MQSALYSFTWEVKPDWRQPYGTQPEILAYLQGIAEEYGILPHCRFATEVTGAKWDEESATWHLRTTTGEVVEAEVLVSAVGMFKEPVWPDIEGLQDFTGSMFHTAQWELDHDLTGRRVAVIGSAASAVQLVPEIVKVGRSRPPVPAHCELGPPQA